MCANWTFSFVSSHRPMSAFHPISDVRSGAEDKLSFEASCGGNYRLILKGGGAIFLMQLGSSVLASAVS